MFDYVMQFLGFIGVNIVPPDTFLAFFPWLLQCLVAFFILFYILKMFSSWVALLVRGGVH